MAPTPNRQVAEPNMKAVLDLFRKDLLQSLNCHAIATVQSFDSAKQTIQASVNYQKTFYSTDPATPPRYEEYAMLVDVPVLVVSGGLASLTMPISQGDQCLVFFNDRDIDNWFSSGQAIPPATSRLHSFSDGIALVGLNSLKTVLEDYDEDRAVLQNDQAKIAVGSSLIEISNEVTDLKTLINGLIDVIITLTTAMSSATPATVVATVATPSATATTALTAYKTTVGGLLG